MYYINKIVGWITSPLGFFFLCVGTYFLLMYVAAKYEKWQKLRLPAKWILAVALASLWVISCGITTRWLGAGLEKDWEIPDKQHGCIEGLQDADAIVVLGGGMGVHAKCGAAEMQGAADRVWHGAKLYKRGKAKMVTLSGPDVEKSTVPLMMDLGVPKDAMIHFSEARNTEEESKLIFKRLSEDITGRKPVILLVTSAWHMNRSKLLFERAGFKVVPAPTDFEMSYVLEKPISVNDFFPSHEALMRNSYAIKEWVANIGYRLLRR